MSGHKIRIEFDDKQKGYHPTNAIRILVDEREVSGITKLVLHMEPDDIIRAEIHCAPEVGGSLAALIEYLAIQDDTPPVSQSKKSKRL